jgi:hypothetical protein
MSSVEKKVAINSCTELGSIFDSVAISSSKGNRQTRPAAMLTQTKTNAIAAKSSQ